MKMVIEIETYYLIDYENVGSDGLSGCDKLNKVFESEHLKKQAGSKKIILVDWFMKYSFDGKNN